MAGRIRDEDVVLVKERADIGVVVGDVVTLRPAGGGSLKGLCPFHEERTPSFSVRPSVGSFHCFGCQESGDVITFVMRIDHLSFSEAVEHLAARTGVELRYEEGGVTPGRQQGQRSRLVEAHRAAAEFYVEQLATPNAAVGRQFLAERNFDEDAARHFGVGFAPQGWDALVTHLRGRRFTDEELLAGGLASQGQRGLIDRFRGRLVWPIRAMTDEVIGFGARKLLEDDNGPKYLNTPETAIYRKSTVLYGVDLAKREIRRRMQAVVVEGYTDVMACHLAGVETAIATCGTSLTDEHIKILRRLLMDQNEFRGEVVFTFDSDAAGQTAALKAFQNDQKFVTQTFVAVEPSGMDPSELRQHKGDTAVRDLIARRVPLFEFAIRSTIGRYDLDTPEGRSSAVPAGMDVVRHIRDVSLRTDYARQLSGWIGLPNPDELVAQARGNLRDVGRRAEQAPLNADDPALRYERDTLKIALQVPDLAADSVDALDPAVFTAPAYAAVHAAIVAAGGAAAAGSGGVEWVARVAAAAADDAVRSRVRELAVEPLRTADEALPRYATEILARLEELSTTRRVAEIKSRLQRLNPVEQVADYNRMFGELIALEAHRRALRERAIGTL